MEQTTDRFVIGIISDTHGLLRPSVHHAFRGVDLILHAGDVGGSDILEELRIIAPVQAVRGNVDPVDDPGLEKELIVMQGGVDIHVSHGHELGSPTPDKALAAYPQRVVIYGHTHKQLLAAAGHRIVVNPGAAGHMRFNLEPSVALLTIEGGTPEVKLVGIV